MYSIFKNYVKTEPKIYNRKLNNLTKGLHKDIGFSTLKNTYFNWVNEEFYVKLIIKTFKFDLKIVI